jgi:hypothetical protein
MRVGERNYAGVVLNLSGTGLFVQTSASAQPGDAIKLTLGGEIPVTAEVVWRRKVAPMLRSVAVGGVGVRIRNAPEAYYSLLASAATNKAGAPDAPAVQQRVAAAAAAAAAPAPAPAPAPACAPARPAPAKRRRPMRPLAEPSRSIRKFRARLKASQGPRSRTLDIDANSTLEAERMALNEAGVGWVLIDLEERKS